MNLLNASYYNDGCSSCHNSYKLGRRATARLYPTNYVVAAKTVATVNLFDAKVAASRPVVIAGLKIVSAEVGSAADYGRPLRLLTHHFPYT